MLLCSELLLEGLYKAFWFKQKRTTQHPVQQYLRWDVSRETADRICSYNRHYAEQSGYWKTTQFLTMKGETEITFYDSVSGKPLFVAPRGRSMRDFLRESEKHGWPSFRDEEVVWENTRILSDGEAVSVDGTHVRERPPATLAPIAEASRSVVRRSSATTFQTRAATATVSTSCPSPGGRRPLQMPR